MSVPHPTGARAAVAALSVVTVVLTLAGCGVWRPAADTGHAASASPGPSATASATSNEAGTPVAALRRLYAVVDRLDGDPAVPLSRLDSVAVGPARDALTSAVRKRRAADRDHAEARTRLSQIVVRPSIRSGEEVTAALQFCSSRQIDAESSGDRPTLQPTTITFRYDAGRWRAYTFGFDSPDCGCSQPIHCG